MNNTLNRIAWVDIFKFFGIWAIYIGHFGEKAGKAYPFVFMYHVPMFFFAAGFFSTNYFKEAPIAFIKKKTWQLMVPYVFFSIVALVFFTLQYDWSILQAKDALMSVVFGIRNQIFAGSLWFIPCLYIIVVGDYFIMKFFKSQLITLAVSFGAFLISQLLLPHNPAHEPSWFMNFDSALYYYFYYSLGAVLFPIINTDKTTTIHRATKLGLTAIDLIVTALTFFQAPYWLFNKITAPFPALAAFKLSIPFFDVFIALIIIYLNLVIAKLCAHIPLLEELGRETLVFCGTEDVTKGMLTQLLAMVNLKARLITPFITIAFSLICLLISNYTLVRFFNTYFPSAVGKASLPARVQSDLPTG